MKKQYENPTMAVRQIVLQNMIALSVSDEHADDSEVLGKERNENIWEEM